jgi:hypothetical protein
MTEKTTSPESLGAAPCSASPVTDDAWESYNRQACGLHYVAHKMRELEQTARELMRICYDEANRLANHGSNGLEKLVMSQLYDAANDAKKKLNKEAQQPRLGEV